MANFDAAIMISPVVQNFYPDGTHLYKMRAADAGYPGPGQYYMIWISTKPGLEGAPFKPFGGPLTDMTELDDWFINITNGRGTDLV